MDETTKPEAPSTESGSQIAQPGMNWYVLRVASNKEDQVRTALERKVAIEGVEDRVGRVLVPTQKERRMKNGVVKVFHRKLYPGYVFVEMTCEEDGSIAEDIWFMVKETTGVGDFISSDGKPTKMQDQDVVAMLAAAEHKDDEPTLAGLNFQKGDPVKITEGSFENYEGSVESVDSKRGLVTVELTIFGRSTPVEVEYWQVEKVQ